MPLLATTLQKLVEPSESLSAQRHFSHNVYKDSGMMP